MQAPPPLTRVTVQTGVPASMICTVPPGGTPFTVGPTLVVKVSSAPGNAGLGETISVVAVAVVPGLVLATGDVPLA